MKKLLLNTFSPKLLLTLLILLTGGLASAQTIGIFESYTIMSINSGANALYDNAPQATASPDFQGANLGTFNATNSLVVKGGQNKTSKNGGGDVTGSNLYYRVWLTSAGQSGTFIALPMSLTSTNAVSGDQQWDGTTGTANVLAGLAPGNYTIEVYSEATGTPGNVFQNNSSNNFRATFTYCGPATGALPAGNYAIPGCFATINAAVAYINSNGVTGSGAVQFDVAAGHTETAPAGGISLTATGTASTSIIFKKAGIGANPTVTASAAQTGGSVTDGVIKIIGSDYITFDGLTILENANIVFALGSNTMTEYGFAMLNATATNGPKNIAITNCTIDMNRLYGNSFGIYSNATHTFGTISTALTTAVGGEHNNIVITKNTITDVNLPINIVGSVTASSQNDGITIGGTGNGNTVTNFGGLQALSSFLNTTGTIFGINIRNSKNFTISNNTFTSATVASLSTLRAIHIDSYNTAPTGTNIININNNNISLGANGAAITGIDISSISGVAGEVNINNNDFNNFTMPSGALSFIRNSQPATINTINNNTFTNINVATAGSVTFISNGFSLASGGSKTVSNNRIVTGFTKLGAGGIVSIYVDAGTSVTGSTVVNDSNNFSNINLQSATTIVGWTNTDNSGTTSMPTKTITNNTFENWRTTAVANLVVMDLNGFGGTLSSVSNNSIKNITKSGAFTLTGISIGAKGNATTLDVKNNSIDGLNGGTSAVTGITSANTATTINIDTNTVKNFASAGSITALTHGTATVNVNFLNNIVENLSSTNGTTMRGITAAGTSVYRVENNSISKLFLTGTLSANAIIIGISVPNGSNATAPIIASNTLFDFTNSNTPTTCSITGINTGGIANHNIFSNTIYNLNAKTLSTGTAALAGIVGISLASSGLTQKCNNNKIYNLNATATSADSVSVVGIGTSGATATGEITRNTIYGFTNTTTGTNPFIAGIFGDGGSWTIVNNMISLTNGSNTNGMQVCGFIDFNSTAGARKFYHNAIHVGGTSTGAQVSALFQFNGAATGSIDVKNNIFNMTRTGSGKNYAVANTGTVFTGITYNNNVLNAANPATVGIHNLAGLTDTTFAQWQTATGGDGNSYSNIPIPFVDTTIADLRIVLPLCSDIESGGVGIVTVPNDYFTTVRNSSTPDIGAHEFTGTRPTAIALTAGSTTVCKDSSTLLTAASVDNTNNYVWSPATGLSATTGASVTATPLVTTTYTVTATNSSGCTSKKLILITVLPSPNNIVLTPTSAAVCSNVVQIINSGIAAQATPVSALMESLSTTFTLTNTSGTGTAAINNVYFSQGANSVHFNTASFNADVQYGYNTNIDLTTFSTAQLQFSHICATEATWDYGYAQYSSDGGTTWISFPTTSYAGTGTLKNSVVSFDKSSYADWNTQFTVAASAPTNALWKTETINIPTSALTNQFRFRFRYTTDSSTNYYGWLIDNVSVTATNPTITWSPIAGLYTDVAATVAYIAGADSKIVYAKNTNATTLSVPYNYTATATLGSCTKSASSTITVTPLAIAGTTTGEQTVCANRVPASLSVSGFSGTVIKWQKSANAAFTTPIDIATSNSATLSAATIGNVTTTTYFRAVVSNSCGDVFSNVVSIKVTTTTYDAAGTWTSGLPNGNMTIVFDKDFTMASNLNGCSCTVNTGKTLTVNSGVSLILKDEINSTGTTIFENGASLIQTDGNTNVNSGNINYKRDAFVKKLDYVYWSTPVASIGATTIYPGTAVANTLKWLTTAANTNGSTGNWQGTAETMAAAKGYAIRVPNTLDPTTPSTITTTFVGVPNNGDYSIAVERGAYDGADISSPNGATITANDDNWNLIGNPYPSAIDAIDFLTANTTTIQGSVDVWTHGTTPGTGQAQPFYGTFGSNYNANDYITFNATGPNSGPTGFNGKIAAGQAFFVKMIDGAAATNASVLFSNTMRSELHNNIQFYRMANSITADNKNRIWLDLVNATTNETTRTLVGYVPGATQQRDHLFDATTDYQSNQSFFSLIGQNIYSIQGRALPFENSDTISMGFAVPTAGTYKIGIHALDGLFANNGQTVYLQDNLTGLVHNLSVSPYTFVTTTGANKTRFVLRYTAGALANSNNDLAANNLVVWKDKATIKAQSVSEPMASIAIFDILGRNVFSQNNINANSFETANVLSQQQALIVKVTMTNGAIVTKKIIF